MVTGGLIVSYTPVGLGKRVGRLTRQAIIQGIVTLISVIITLVLFLALREQVGPLFVWLMAIGSVVGIARTIWYTVEMFRARRIVERIPLRPALQLQNIGMTLATNPDGEQIAWERIRDVRGVSKSRVPGPCLEVTWDDSRRWRVPLVELDVRSQDLDSALRAFSRGRFGLDLSRVDEIW